MPTGRSHIIVSQHSVVDVIIPRIEVWHTSTRLTTMILDVVSEALDVLPPRAARVLQEGADVRWFEAGNLLAIVVPAVFVNAVDELREGVCLVTVDGSVESLVTERTPAAVYS